MSRKRKHCAIEEPIQDLDDARRLYCLCRTPEDPEKLMVRCDLCDDWFHPNCVSLDEEEAKNIAQWFCPGCIEVMKINPTISRKSLLAFQGRVAPTSGWSDGFPIKDIDERIIVDNIQTKRHKVEGWTLFREGKVIGLSSNCVGPSIYFRSQCQAAMKQKSYTIYMCLKDGGLKLKWGTCSCPAGIDGQCKHLVATLYSLIDLHRQEVESIPDVKTCTEKLQMWHVRKPTSDEPLLFRDMAFVKHDPSRPIKKDLCAAAVHHTPVPDFAKVVTCDDISKLVNVFDASGIKLPILDTLRSNEFQPVAYRQHSDIDLQLDLFNSIENSSFSDCPIPEISSEVMVHYASTVEVDSTRAKFIERHTRLQSRTSFWFDERRYRLTASNFGTFCRLRESTNPVNTFQQRQKFFTTKSVRHGIDYEAQAFALYQGKRPCMSSAIGLIVNPKLPHIAVTPDRLVKINDQLRIVELKCPYSVFKKKTSIAAQMKENNFYLHIVNGEIQLKKSHDYYYQIQGQLNLCGLTTCDLVVYVPPDDMVIIEVPCDREFFNSTMLPKLNNIYFNSLLPHFVENLLSSHS